MQHKDLPQAEQYIRRHRRRRIWKRVTGGLACAAVCITLYILARPGFAMEMECEIPEHTHTDSCYQSMEEGSRELICGMEEHVHDDTCMAESMTAAENGSKAEPQTEEGKTPEEAPAEEEGAEETPEEEKDPEEAPAEEEGAEETPEEENLENAVQEEGNQEFLGEIETLTENSDETTGETLPNSAVTGTAGGVEWSFSEDGKLVLSVSDTGILPTYGEITEVPWFGYAEEIKSIEIQPGVSGIDGLSFAICQSLQEITTPEGENQKYLSEDGVLFNKDKTVLITCLPAKTGSYVVPGTVNEIEDFAFAYCTGLTAIEIPEGVTSLGEWLFMYCQNLESVTLPDGLTEISDYIFGACTKLTEIKIPASVTSIGVGAFASCTGLTEIEIPASVTSIGQQAFAGSGLKKATFQEGVTSIAPNVFYGCSSLTEVNLPESLTEIGESAFENSGLTSLTLPKNLASIGEDAFRGCSALAEIRLETGGPVTGGENAFRGCSALNTVIVSSSVKNLDSSILSAVEDSMETLKFEGPNEFTYTGISVVSVGDVLLVPGFSYIVSVDGTLTQGTASGTCGDQGDNVTWTLSGDGKLVISGTGAMEEFATAYSAPWYGAAELIRSVEVQEGVTSVSPYAFYGCKSMTQASLADSVTSLGSYSFYNCESLSDLRLPENLTEMGASVFERCDALSSVTIPGKVKKIGDYAFQDCVSLKTVTLGEGVQEIGQYAFDGCSSLEKVELNKGLLTIGNRAFYDCTSLAAADLPSTLTALGESAFYNCEALKSVVIPDGLEEIKSQTFRNCSSLAEVTLGKGLTAIGANAFQSCSGLKTVTVRTAALDGVVDGSTIFSSCSGITKVVIADTVKTLSYYDLIYITYGVSSYSSKVDLAFEGENAFQFVDGTFKAKNVSLSTGAYTVDSQGRLGKSGTCENGLTWKMSPDGTLTISGNGTMEDFSYTSSVPWSKEFGASIKKVVIEEGVQSIGSHAFDGCTALEEVELPDGLTRIGSYAFNGCSSLKSAILPDTVEEIGSYAFQSAKEMETLQLPENLQDAGYGMLDGCTGLKKVTLRTKNEVDSVSWFLSGCKKIEEIVIADTVKELGSAFLGGLPEDVNLVFEGPNTFTYIESSSLTVGGVELRQGVYEVDADGNLIRTGTCGENVNWKLSGDGTLTISGAGPMDDYNNRLGGNQGMPSWYAYRTQIKKVVIEDGVTSIGKDAFRKNTFTGGGYENLETVQIGKDVETIGETAFASCGVLGTVTFAEDSGLKVIGEGAFQEAGIRTAVLPSGVEEIGEDAFDGCASLEEITIPKNVKEIKSDAFQGCTSLAKVDFEEGSALEKIGGSAFAGTAIERVEIPAGVKELGSNAFERCASLKKVVFAEDGVLSIIGSGAFANTALTEISIPDTVQTIGSSGFLGTDLTSVEIPASVTNLGASAFEDCESLTSAKFASGSQITAIQSGTFSGTALAEIEMPDTVTKIGDSAFLGTKLETAEIPAAVTEIGESAFENCTGLGTVVYGEPSSLKTIGDRAFANTALTETVIPGKAASIGSQAFAGCDELRKVTLNAAELTSTGEQAFDGSVEELVVSDSVDHLTYEFMSRAAGDPCGLTQAVFQGENEFTYSGQDYLVPTPHGDVLLTEGVLYRVDETGAIHIGGTCGEGLQWDLEEDGTLVISGTGDMTDYTDGTEAPWYKYAEQITKLEVGADVASLGSYAFAACPELGEITFKEGSILTEIGDYAFAGGKPLISVTLPEGTKRGQGVFQGCTHLTSVNEKTDLAEVMTEWDTGIDVFYRTGLWENYLNRVSVADESISKEESNGRTISISTQSSREMLTGQVAQTTLNIDKGEGHSETVVRIYFSFDNEYGKLQNYEPGQTYYFGEEGSQIKAQMVQSSMPYTYYMEIPETEAGQTLNVTLNSIYENYTPGGTGLIFFSLLDSQEAAELGTGVPLPEELYRFSWDTKPREFAVSKSAYGTLQVSGEDAQEGRLEVNGFDYNISMTASSADYSDYGADPMDSALFEDTMILPEHFYWREDLLDAVQKDTYAVGKLNYNTYEISFRAGEEWIDVCRMYDMDDAVQDSIELKLDEKGQLVISWLIENSNDTAEISNSSIGLEFYDGMIWADQEALADEADGKEELVGVFTNQIDVTQNYRFSPAKVKTDTADYSVAIGSPDYEITKTNWEGNPEGNSAEMGTALHYEIILRNRGILAYEELTYLEDPLNEYLYIRAEDIEAMLEDSECGSLLEITIDNATLCEEVQEEVTLTDGTSCVLNQQYLSTDAPYDGRFPAGQRDPDITAEDVTIVIGWSEDGSCIELNVKNLPYNNQPCVMKVGEGQAYGSVQEALDSLGYLVDQDVTYTCRWNLEEEILDGGSERSFLIRSTAKDSFMRLEQDQNWFILDAYTYQSVDNLAYCYNTKHEMKTAKLSYASRIYRDYELYKSVKIDGEDPEESSVQLKDGAIMEYTLWGRNQHRSYLEDTLPLTDRMTGNQALLLPVGYNAGNETLQSAALETKEIDGTAYYILSQEGTYKNLVIDGKTADTVTVKKTAGGLETLIHWYFKPARGLSDAIVVDYSAILLDSLAGEGGMDYSLKNEVWLGGRPSHRLYDATIFGGKRVLIEKNIVTNLDEELENEINSTHSYRGDTLDDRSVISEGETVTYRLDLERVGISKGTVYGSSLQDYLPASLNEYWDQENVSVTYVAQNGMEMEITAPGKEGWEIVGDPQNPQQQILKWKDDFSITLNGTAYIYVQLTFPSGEEWEDYSHAFGSRELKNTFLLDKMQDEVFHEIHADAQVLLQKGVCGSGSYMEQPREYTLNTNEDALWYYSNDGQNKGCVIYYIALYNSGDSRVYLSGIQDILPEGFAFAHLYDTSTGISRLGNNLNYYDSLIDIEAEDVVYKTASIKYETAENGVLTYHLSKLNNNENSISYDEERERYYLQSKEAVVFAYVCDTNKTEDTQDRAENLAAMPYYDYSGADYSMDEDTPVHLKMSGQRGNDGGRTWIENAYADHLGMDTSETGAGTRWLSSSVEVRRGSIMPGLVKTASEPFAHTGDDVEWTVRAINSGNEAIRDYTLTDVMQKPYQFTGDVEIAMEPEDSDGSHSFYYLSGRLFTIKERDEEKNEITLSYRPGRYKDDVETTVKMDGTPKELNLCVSDTHNNVVIEVSISKDENGNERLSLFFPEDGASALSIMPDCHAKLTLHTKNSSTDYANTSYYNTAYLTPDKTQSFHKAGVSQGSYTLYEGKPSVASEATVSVSYGYATASEKGVAELDASGVEPENQAGSNSAENYIVLSEKDSLFRYTLTVQNTGGSAESAAIQDLILLDNLPQSGDHATFYDEIPRSSEFQVNFADDPEFSVEVNGEKLAKDQYQLEYSEEKSFDEADRHGAENDEKWSTAPEDVTKMRSFRLRILDKGGTGAEPLIPAGAEIKVSFNAEAAGDPEPSMTAWNSFGYSYALKGSPDSYLDASPRKVGVRMASSPFLSKRLVDADGNDAPAEKDETFVFLIYEGGALEGVENLGLADAAQKLQEAGRSFTKAELSVAQGRAGTEELELKNLKCWTYADEDGRVSEAEEPWEWENFEAYTILELPQKNGEEEAEYVFGDINGYGGNNMTFTYQSAHSLVLSCTNVRSGWSLQLFKRSLETDAPLAEAVFALYSPDEQDSLEDEAYEELTKQYGLKPEKTVQREETTWYLKDVESSGAGEGVIEWRDLTKDRYYLLELRAPEGYKLNEQPGQIIEAPEGGTGELPITVHNSGYELPETGGPGTAGYTLGGAALAAGALTALAYRKRKKGSAV